MNLRTSEIASKLVGYRGLGLMVVGLFFIGSYFGGPQRVEDATFSLTSRIVSSPEHSPRVALLAIDEESLARLGPWPWSRALLAGAIDRLRALKVRAIGLMVPLSEPQTPSNLEEMSKSAGTASSKVRSALRRWIRRLDTDRSLSRAMGKSGNVVIMASARASVGGGIDAPWAGAAALSDEGGPSLREIFKSIVFTPPLEKSVTVEAPLERLSKAAAGVGVTEPSGTLQGQPGVKLLLLADERYSPTFVAQLMVQSLNVGDASIQPVPGGGVRIGQRQIVTTPDYRYYPSPLSRRTAESGLHLHTVADLWRKDGNLSDLRGVTVLVGPTAPSLMALLGMPPVDGISPAVSAAYALSSLIEANGFDRPEWFYGGQRGFILAMALLVFLPAGFHGRRSMALAGALTLILLNGGLVALVTRQMWVPVALPSLCAVCLLGALSLRRAVEAAVIDVEREAGELRLRFAMNLHAQDKWDEAFDEYRRCPSGPVLMEKLYQLGLDYERRRILDRAASVYKHLTGFDPKFKDVKQRLERLDNLAGNYPGLAPGGTSKDTVLVADTKLEKPMLGHYQLESQIGRGAMAQVYLANDLKLGRKVALKVLAIRDGYHGDDVEAIEQRFRREAEAEARMSHPNIVTVYEAGKHGDHVYIAMDFVDGTTLEEFTDPDNLLPVQEVVGIGIQVAQALDYAHSKEIIHRDVKPSNILYIRESRFVKVSDFGIARLNDGDQTRTGTILGTPSYMSPEQAVGGRIDGRSDLFSLGTTLYQLLSGALPFTGDSVPTIMFQITKERHRSLKRVRPDLDRRLCRIVDTALEKDLIARYQTGLEMAEALEACMDSTADAGAAKKKSRRRSNSKARSRSSAA